MAWHILHGLLEQVRIHSTFPGKLWIVMMFIFRILVVARIGDHVYHDEQASFICNTLTPGCRNVCFNVFSPISQLRFWSLMVLAVSSPGILFCLYASHKIYHAYVKFPLVGESNEDNKWDTGSTDSSSGVNNTHPPSYKRKRKSSSVFPKANAPPLYEVTRLNSKKDDVSDKFKVRKAKGKAYENINHNRNEKKDFPPNNCPPYENPRRWQPWSDHSFTSFCPQISDKKCGKYCKQYRPRQGYPIYADRYGGKVEYIAPVKPFNEIQANKAKKIMLENPQLYRAYWWHVFFRTLLEVAFLVGQYFLYGFFVAELFECERWPCPKTVDCFVSRPMEKTCLMWLMFGLGAVSCALSIGEFWTLGWKRFTYAVCCRGHKMTYEEKRKRLAGLAQENKHHHDHVTHYHKPHHDEILMVPSAAHFMSQLSLESASSETTVESV